VFPDQPERGVTYWDWTLAPMLDSAGEVECLVFSLVDVTEQARASEAQRAAALYARSLIEASLDPLVTISPAGQVTDVNKATEEATGEPREALIGTDFADYFTDPEQARQGYREVLARGQVRDYPLTIRNVSGARMDVLYNASTYRGQDGEIVGVFSAARDMTARQQAEALRSQLAEIVRSSHDAIVGKSLDGVITSWNQGAVMLYGIAAEEAIGRHVSMLAPEESKGEFGLLLDRIRAGDTIADFETQRVRSDGSRIDLEMDLSPIRDGAGRVVGVSSIARDVTARRQAERTLIKVNRALQALSSCNGALIHATDERGLLDEMCKIIVDLSGYCVAWVGYVEPGVRRAVRPVAYHGQEPGSAVTVAAVWSDDAAAGSPVGLAVRTGRAQVVQDVAREVADVPWRAHALKLGCRSVLVAPLASEGRVLGVLSIHATEVEAFDEGEISLLAELAGDMAFGLTALRIRDEHQRDVQRVQLGMERTIQAISATVEMRDPYTAGHQRRVADLAAAIAQALGLPEQRVHGMRLAAVVHDVGKIHVPSEILSKPGRLEMMEFELVKTHSQAGYEILKDIDFPWPIAQVVLQHHERLDGSGYPRG